MRAKPATSRGIPGAARSSLDVFALASEMPDILKGETARLPPKRHIHRVWLISRDLCLRPLIVLSPSIRQLIVNKVQLHGSPKQSTKVVDNSVEKAEVRCEL